ncbi:lytic murein transglycosylase [Candidatus Nomurabacteria bacterium]|nr:lytic murein transglycosylase [Candidatus Nomurabacteria bacterium]
MSFKLSIGALFLFLALSGAAMAQTLSPEERAKLQAEYDQLQEEIVKWQKVLDETRAKKNTIQGDVSALDAQIKKAQAEINQRNNTISRLSSEIRQKSARISTLEERLDRGKESLAKLLREKYQSDQQSLAVLALSAQDLSDFYATVDSIDIIDRELQSLFDELRGVKQQTEEEKAALAERQDKEFDARYEVEVKKKEIATDQAQKKELLAVTASEERSYSQVLADRQRRAEEIRSALFELRDTQGISFETALAYAQEASGKTGVRAAFILGILRQESNLGKNVGQCLLTDATTGAGKGKNTGTPFARVMRADEVRNDAAVFLNLMQKLGRDPYSTPVSCPIAGVGYGGAMGPSQFIPTTWVGLESRISSLVGVSTPDPWSPKHAIHATALFLADLGAGRGTPSAEREAAGRYYAGGNWATLGLGYANSVLGFAAEYQANIDFLNDL